MQKFLSLLLSLLLSVCILNAQSNSPGNDAALQLVNSNRASLGLSIEDLSNVIVSGTYYDNTTGLKMVYLNQVYRGIPLLNQMLVLAFKEGKLVSQAGKFNHGVEKFTGGKNGIFSVSAETAVQAALSDRGLAVTKMAVTLAVKNDGRYFEFNDMGISRENITAELIWIPIEEEVNHVNAVTKIELAWQVKLVPKVTSDYWMISVNATDKRILDVDN